MPNSALGFETLVLCKHLLRIYRMAALKLEKA
jgi:hypothetical protein